MSKLIWVWSQVSGLIRYGERGAEATSGSTSDMTVMERLAVLLDGVLFLIRQVSFKRFVVTGMLLLVIVLSVAPPPEKSVLFQLIVLL